MFVVICHRVVVTACHVMLPALHVVRAAAGLYTWQCQVVRIGFHQHTSLSALAGGASCLSCVANVFVFSFFVVCIFLLFFLIFRLIIFGIIYFTCF